MKKLFLVLAALAGTLPAHEGVEHAKIAAAEAKAAVAASAKEAKDAAAKTAGKAVASTKEAVSDLTSTAKEGAQKAAGEAVVMIQPFEVLRAHAGKHLHNKIVHFPLALGIFGALFLLLSFRYPSYKWPARVLLFVAGVAGIAALFTGSAQGAEFEGTSLAQVLEYHGKIAFNSLVLIWGALLLSFFEVTRKFFWLYAIILIAGLILAGGLGGILATA